jgi:Tol biopolymer transport system component
MACTLKSKKFFMTNDHTLSSAILGRLPAALCAAALASTEVARAGVPARLTPFEDPGGCALERVTDATTGELHFQFEGLSHDDRSLFVAWEKGKDRGAYILDVATGKRRDVPAFNNAGVFSPDDSRILVANSIADGSTELYEIDIGSGRMTPIAPHPKHDFLATYSPDGQWILFNSYRTGRSDIYVIPRGGGEALRLTDSDAYEAHAVFSPDMKAILFHRDLGNGNYDIFRMDFATRAVAPFISGPGEQSYPSWSPDGRFVALASDQGEASGKADIYVADATGSVVTRVTRSPGYNAYPSWSHDGRWLYFTSERPAGTRNVFRAAIDASGRCTPLE